MWICFLSVMECGLKSVLCQQMEPFDKNSLSSLFSSDDLAQCFLFNNEFVCCNLKAIELVCDATLRPRKKLTVSDISPQHQPDGIPSELKAQNMLAICQRSGEHSFNWVYRKQSGGLAWLSVSLRKVEVNHLVLFHVTSRQLQVNSELSEQALDDKNRSSSLDFNHYVLLNEYKRAIDQSSIVSKADKRGIITYVNDKFVQVSGYSREELIGKPHSIISHVDTPRAVFKDLWQTISKGKVWKGIIKNCKKNGDTYYVDSSISPIMDAQGNISEFIAIRNDITEMYQQEKLIIYQNTDELTGLPNRTKLELDLAENRTNYLAVVRFKELEQFSHVFSTSVYQQILANIAELIQEHFSLLQTGICLYKISTLKYAITCGDELEASGFQYQLEALLNLIIQMDMKVEGFDIPLTVQAGWCQGKHLHINNALLALKEASAQGVLAAQFEANNNTFKTDIENAIDWTVKLKSAISEGKVSLFGQRIVDNVGAVYSTEVLMRYHESASNAFISPNVFLKHAKKSKIYNQLSKFVIAQSCLHFKRHKQRFSINFTLADLQDPEIRQQVIQLLKDNELGPYLTLELLETEAFADEDKVVTEFLYQLKGLGVQIAIDDFGSGYSNFNYFTLLPVDIVKIDGSLISNIDSNDKHFLLVKSIAEFCHQMNIKVVAEFVENEAIFNKLKTLKIDYFQGYHFHQPEQLS